MATGAVPSTRASDKIIESKAPYAALEGQNQGR